MIATPPERFMIVTPPERLIVARIDSPVGAMVAASDERDVLRGLWFDEPEEAAYQPVLNRLYSRVPVAAGSMPDEIRSALERYFAGNLAALNTIPWGLAGTAFQQAVWSALSKIPAGTTTSYGLLAAQIGRPKAVRAVGAANGANPISLVVPCHRVIGSNQTLTGYGGGLHRKRWLLAHEGVLLPGLDS